MLRLSYLGVVIYFQRRAVKLQQQKQKEELQRAQQKEREQEKERALTAKVVKHSKDTKTEKEPS